MSSVNASSGENRDSGQERHPMDLASKNALKPGDSVKTVVNTQQPVLGSHARGPSATLGHVQGRILSSGISTVGSVPVCVTTSNTQASTKQGGGSGMTDQGGGLASVVLMSVPRSGLPAAASAASGVASVVQSTTTGSRSSSTPTVSATTTYHVPRGAAAVANIAAPRPGTTSLGRPTPGATAITHASNLVTGLRGIVPRASSPATTWLGTVSQSSATGGTSRPRTPTVTSMTSYTQPRTPTLAVVTSRPATPQGTRVQVQAEPLRSQNLHSNLQKVPTVPTSQNISVGSAAAQVLVSQPRTQQPTAPTASSISSSVTVGAQVVPGSTTITSSPLVAVSSVTSPASGTASPRPVQAALLSATPRSAPVTSNVRPANSVNATGNRTGTVTATVTAATATLALAVGTQVRPRLTSSGPSRLTTSVPAPRLLTTPARPTTATAATVLPTQARLGVPGAASVVSLHPVVVSAGGGLPLKNASTRPTLGPKVISQPMHAPASIQITQMPVNAVQAPTKLPAASTALSQAPATRTVTYSTNAAMVTGGGGNARPVNVTTSTLANPVTKVTLHAAVTQPSATQPVSQQPQTQQSSQPQTQASVCIQHRVSPAPSTGTTPLAVEHTGTSVLSTYNIPAYLYEPSAGGGGSTYQVTGVVARPYPATGGSNGAPGGATTYTVQTSAAAVLRPSGVVATSSPVKFNPVVVVDPSRSSLPVHSSYLQEGGLTPTPDSAPPPPPPPAVSKPSASPRPSILRKRDNEGSPMKAQKNLTPILSSLGATPTSGTASNSGSGIGAGPPVSPPSPRRPDSRGGGGGNSSGGSTTISATSSPGLGEASEEATPLTVKQEVGEEVVERPPPEMSPRKKPRKQQLTGNELHEPKFSEDEMEFISEERIKKEVKEGRLREAEETVLRISIPPPEEHIEKPPLPPARRRGLTLLAGYRHNWKSRHNHYVRYSDVRPKDERRPTVSELAAQKQVLQKLEGWKVHHLSTQMEELSELEQQVSERLTGILKLMEKRMGKELEKDINRINELIKGNMQRSKVTSDQMQEAKSQVMKIFEHKNHVADIINRSGNKRSLKKREKS
ncbi:hypothetical protein R5R35_013419 [Gryllus longicercus]|uniref:Histone deacetylase complex subunit SAP130 C-terminal domain-containing protein n=1 Tax=Gryllus longicercus TaxID=2509291 RepID=A0AAN9W156_9ORTH